jgi:hypothetical protein
MDNEKYVPLDTLKSFSNELTNWEQDLGVMISEIRAYAPKGINGEIEENSFLKVRQAQLQITRFIHERLNNIIKEFEV